MTGGAPKALKKIGWVEPYQGRKQPLGMRVRFRPAGSQTQGPPPVSDTDEHANDAHDDAVRAQQQQHQQQQRHDQNGHSSSSSNSKLSKEERKKLKKQKKDKHKHTDKPDSTSAAAAAAAHSSGTAADGDAPEAA